MGHKTRDVVKININQPEANLIADLDRFLDLLAIIFVFSSRWNQHSTASLSRLC